MPGLKGVSNLNKEKIVQPYKPSTERQLVGGFVFKRIEELKVFRRELKIEDEWKDADNEIIPRPINEIGNRKRFESDDELGLRTRLVPVSDETQDWRSTNSDPTLLVKIQIALSIIIDTIPEAVFKPVLKRYDKTTTIARALWERNWDITGAREVYKLFAFNLFKYGWAAGRTYPREVKYSKQILERFDAENPENSTFTDNENTLFSDVFRENLDPKMVWLDPAAKPYDPLTRNEVYYEVPYSEDQADIEFGTYKDWGSVKANYINETSENIADTEEEKKGRRKQVLIGFYQNRSKDLYSIIVPNQNIVLYYSPLPNDDGMLDIWDAPLILRSANSPYGISLWRIIKQDKELYDKMKNMTMDQLVISIMKMGFISGTAGLTQDNVYRIVPGKFEVLPANAKVDWMEVPGPGQESFEGLKYLKQIIDDNSGITPTLEGQVTGKTLGEILHAKEAALKRLRTPIENIASAVEQDAYLTLSWMTQLYSTPEVKSFVDLTELTAFEHEMEMSHHELFISAMDEETGEPTSFKATFYPQLNLKLENKGGKLIEAKKDRFFQVGKDLQIGDLRWRGIIKINYRSIVSTSPELEKQKKMEMFNILAPLLPQPPEIFAKACKQLIVTNDEKPEEWLPDNYIKYLNGESDKTLFISAPVMVNDKGKPVEGQPFGAPEPNNMSGERMSEGFESMQGQAGIRPNQGAPTVLPQSQVGGQQPGTFNESLGNTLGR